MESNRLVQIVPIRARRAEGVGDYARIIAERLRADAGMVTTFVSCTPLAERERCSDEWETIELAERRSKALCDVLDGLRQRDGTAPVLLHLSGYGYDPKGAPFWLASALKQWRRQNPTQKLVIVFHELFANGPILSRLFWLGRVQRVVTRSLQRIADAGIVTLGRQFDWLRRAGEKAGPVHLVPCFSTVGEADGALEIASRRAARLVVFGRAANEIYGHWGDRLAEFVRANAIEEIVDIGPRPMPPPQRIGDAPLSSLGEVDPQNVREELTKARFGVLRYDADWLPKSSILAAYCAHGVIPVCLSGQAGDIDGLLPGENYLRLDPAGPVPHPAASAIDQLQARAQAWYSPHSIGPTTALLRKLLT